MLISRHRSCNLEKIGSGVGVTRSTFAFRTLLFLCCLTETEVATRKRLDRRRTAFVENFVFFFFLHNTSLIQILYCFEMDQRLVIVKSSSTNRIRRTEQEEEVDVRIAIDILRTLTAFAFVENEILNDVTVRPYTSNQFQK